MPPDRTTPVPPQPQPRMFVFEFWESENKLMAAILAQNQPEAGEKFKEVGVSVLGTYTVRVFDAPLYPAVCMARSRQ